jgi:hypothetical protein
MFRPFASRWLLTAVLVLGLVALASPASAHGGFGGGHGGFYGGHGYYGRHGGYYGGHGYYSPYYYGRSYAPSWRGYGWPYGSGAALYGWTPYPTTSYYYGWAPSRWGGRCW